MAGSLKPCGTFAAYKRHNRRGEEPCDECAQAAREQKSSRDEAKRVESGESRLSVVAEMPASVSSAPDPLEVARDSLEHVEGALRSPMTPASSVASLTRRREELVDQIVRLTNAQSEEVSAIERFAARRQERIAKAQA